LITRKCNKSRKKEINKKSHIKMSRILKNNLNYKTERINITRFIGQHLLKNVYFMTWINIIYTFSMRNTRKYNYNSYNPSCWFYICRKYDFLYQHFNICLGLYLSKNRSPSYCLFFKQNITIIFISQMLLFIYILRTNIFTSTSALKRSLQLTRKKKKTKKKKVMS
jgi:hypothetical protein